jgi:cobalt-zinc-cadmium resistance protein CzcA
VGCYRNYFNDGCITNFYKYFDGKEFKAKFKTSQHNLCNLTNVEYFICLSQNTNTELDSLIVSAGNNNKGLKASQLQVDKYQANINSAFTFEKLIFIIILIQTI